MSIKSSNFECNKIMSQDEEVVALYSYGELVYENDYPYIAGHVTDGSSTFTFRVNNADVTVNVGANGWWKWKAPSEEVGIGGFSRNSQDYVTDILIFNGITTIGYDALHGVCWYKRNLKKLEFRNCDLSTGSGSYIYSGFFICGCSQLEEIVGFSDGSIIHGETNYVGAQFTDYPLRILNLSNLILRDGCQIGGWFSRAKVETLTLNNIPANAQTNGAEFSQMTQLRNFNIVASIESSISFPQSTLLTYQSMLNIANALCDNNNNDEQLTITFNSTAWNALTEEQKDTIALIFLDKNWTIAT